MKQVIIIHGSPDEEEYHGSEWPSPSNGFWIPWIQKELSRKDILSQALEFPKPYNPTYLDWVNVFEQLKINNETILIGHSSGAGFLLRYFSEHTDVMPNKIILVGPWIDPEKDFGNFLEFKIDQNLTNKTEVHSFMSSDDEEQLSSFKIIEEELPNAVYHKFTNRGHFTRGNEIFPELLEIILK